MVRDASKIVAPRAEAGLTSWGGLGNQQHHDEEEHMRGVCLVRFRILLIGLHVQQGLIICATILLIESKTTKAPDPDREFKLSTTPLLQYDSLLESR